MRRDVLCISQAYSEKRENISEPHMVKQLEDLGCVLMKRRGNTVLLLCSTTGFKLPYREACQKETERRIDINIY